MQCIIQLNNIAVWKKNYFIVNLHEFVLKDVMYYAIKWYLSWKKIYCSKILQICQHLLINKKYFLFILDIFLAFELIGWKYKMQYIMQLHNISLEKKLHCSQIIRMCQYKLISKSFIIS